MPNIKSAKKRVRSNERKADVNTTCNFKYAYSS